MIDKIVWQPGGIYQSGNDFHIALENKFAEKLLASKIGAERQMINYAREVVKERGINYPEVYIFHKDTAFVSEFHIGHNGKWLSLERNMGIMPRADEKYIYHSHNADSSSDAYALMALFDMWGSYADFLIEK